MTLAGVATRPPGSDSYPPAVGTRVPWRLSQPVQDLLDQGNVYGYRNQGTLGNLEHLQHHGGHTPWSADKMQGVIYAKDTEMPGDFEAWLVEECKSSYDTTWIQFFNINNRQYDNAGVDQGSSADHHLHVSVGNGYENTHVSLFKDYHDK